MVKTLRLFLVAALAMVGLNAMADTSVTFVLNDPDAIEALGITLPAAGKGTKIESIVKDGVTIAATTAAGKTDTRIYQGSGKNAGKYDFRIYGGGTLTFTAGDNAVKKIVVTGTTTMDMLSGDGYTASSEKTTGTWEGDAQSVTLTATGTATIYTITVTYGVSTDTRTATTIEFAEGYDIRFTYGPQGEDVSLPTATVKAGGTPIDAAVAWSLTKDAAFHVGDAEPAIEGNKVKPSNHSYGKLTLTASYAGDASNKPSSKSYTLTVFKGRMSIAEFMDEFLKTYNEGGDLSSWTTRVPTSYWQLEISGDQITHYNAIVTYVNGSYTYIRDDKGKGLLLYGSNLGVKEGDVITSDLGGAIGAIYGELYTYNGLMELATTADQTLFYVKEHGQTVTPTTITCDKLVENMNNYVEIKNAEYVSTTTGTGSNPKKTFNFKVGDKEFAAYDVWKLGDTQEFTVGEKYTLTGFGALYINADATVKTPQLYFESATAGASGIKAVKANAQFEGKMYNLAGQVVNKGYKGLVIMNGRKFVNK